MANEYTNYSFKLKEMPEQVEFDDLFVGPEGDIVPVRIYELKEADFMTEVIRRLKHMTVYDVPTPDQYFGDTPAKKWELFVRDLFGDEAEEVLTVPVGEIQIQLAVDRLLYLRQIKRKIEEETEIKEMEENIRLFKEQYGV